MRNAVLTGLLAGVLAIAAVFGSVEFLGPAAHAQAVLYSIEINGTPISGNAPLNLVAQPGVLFSSPQTVNGVTEVDVSPDTAVMLSRLTDIASADHLVIATSSPSGVTYSGATSPAIAGYSTGQWLVLLPDVATQVGATLNLQGLGPVGIQGACSQICILLAVGPATQPSGPVAAFVVH